MMREAITRSVDDGREQKRLRDEEELHELSTLEGLSFLMRHKTCREWLWDLLSRLRPYTPTSALVQPNVGEVTQFYQGMENAALLIEQDCKDANLDAYLQMMREGLELERIREGQDQPKEQARKKQRGGNRGRRKLEEMVKQND